MNFSSMDYFIVLAREQSFTRAAEQLHLTQQSLSFHIAGLEKELGCRLFIRHSPLRLTYAGEVFLRYANRFQKEMTQMRQEFSDIADNRRGVLRVGIAPTRGRLIMPDIIDAFQEAFPSITVEMQEAANSTLHERLLKSELHLAIASFPDGMQGLTLREFYKEEVYLLISEECFRRTYGDEAGAIEAAWRAGDYRGMDRCPFVQGNLKDIGGRIGLAVMRRAGIESPRIRAASGNMETLLALCARGVGACFCPENLANDSLRDDELSRLMFFSLGEEARYPIRFGYPDQAYRWSVTEAFMECAMETMGITGEARRRQ